MAKKNHDADLLDWTVAEAPDPDESTPFPPVSPPPLAAPDGHPETLSPKISRRLWLIAGGLIVASLLGLALFSAWDRYRVWRAVEQMVALEEQAALAGDTGALTQLYDPGATTWAALQIQRVRNGQAAPLPMTVLRPVPEPGRLRSVETLTPDTVRADVVHQFLAPDGSRASFALPQFYRYANGAWKRTAPPATYRGELQKWSGKHIDLSYFAIDEDFAQELGPYLDGVISQVCAAWTCPEDPKIGLDFLLDNTSPSYITTSPGEPLLFKLLFARAMSAGGPTSSVPAPHLAGYPADTASTELLKHLLALETLTRATDEITRRGQTQSDNAFAYALAVRMGVRLKLEAPEAATIFFANPAFTTEELWAANTKPLYPQAPYDQQAVLHQALAMLNVILRDQPPETEDKLFRSLHTAPDPVAWLSEGLGIAPEEARARLLAAVGSTDGIQVQLPTSTRHEFTLGCRGGLALFSRGDSQPTYFLSGDFFGTFFGQWSPDGQRLLIYLSGQPAVVDMTSGAITWLPNPSRDYYTSYAYQWASDTVVAYTLWPRWSSEREPDPSQYSLNFLDTASSEQPYPSIPRVQGYALAPDDSTAAIVQIHKGYFDYREGRIALMLATGGPTTPVADGVNPVWSPDGRSLLYTYFDGATFSLRIAEPATGNIREVLSVNDLGITEGSSATWSLGGDWSPTGEQIAFYASRYSSDGSQARVGTVGPDGSNRRILMEQHSQFDAFPSGYSADGKFLAVTVQNWGWPQQTIIYDATTGEARLTLPNLGGSLAWSPTGHQLALGGLDGLYLLAEPGDPRSQPEKLVGDECYSILWNPAP